MEGGLTGLGEKVQHVALLLAQCGADRKHAFDETTALRTVGPEAGVAPDDTVAQGALGGVVGRRHRLVVLRHVVNGVSASLIPSIRCTTARFPW